MSGETRSRFEVLGLHARHEDGYGLRGTARVRMFIARPGQEVEVVDEDFDLPALPPASLPEEALYAHLITPRVEARMISLEGVQ